MKRLIIFAAVFLPIALSAYTSPGKPAGFVNDFGQMLSQETKISLESKLAAFKQSTSNEIVVATINRLEDETIETYAEKLFHEWGIGDEKLDNGLLLLISREDREMRIEVGYGLEPIITDIESSRIIREELVPAFQDGKYDLGVSEAIDRIINDINNGVPPPEERRVTPIPDIGAFFYPAIVLIVMLASFLGRSKSWWAGGVIGAFAGIIIGAFLGFIFTGVIAVVVLTFVGLIFDYLVSKSYHKHKNGGGPPPWFLGGGGGGNFGGGGFGGFGGGMSGGGGASGRW